MIYKKELLDINWYLDRMSMFLKESYGIKEQYKWFIDQINSIDFTSDNMMKMLDLYNVLWNKDNPWKFIYKGKSLSFNNYTDLTSYFDGLINENGTKGVELSYLDIIANLNGINREFAYTYYEKDKYEQEVEQREIIRLNNTDLYRYILITIAKNNYDGTFEMIKETYYRAFKDLLPENSTIDDSPIIYFTFNNSSIQLNVEIGVKLINGLSEDVIKAFKSDIFIIKSMGIKYNVTFFKEQDSLFTLDINNNLDNPKYVL